MATERNKRNEKTKRNETKRNKRNETNETKTNERNETKQTKRSSHYPYRVTAGPQKSLSSGFICFRFVSFRFGSVRFDVFHFVSLRFVSFRFVSGNQKLAMSCLGTLAPGPETRPGRQARVEKNGVMISLIYCK